VFFLSCVHDRVIPEILRIIIHIGLIRSEERQFSEGSIISRQIVFRMLRLRLSTVTLRSKYLTLYVFYTNKFAIYGFRGQGEKIH